jgi:indole-3-acetaldehyde oxidase
MTSVNLSAHAYWTPDPSFTSYLNYGAAISEVSLTKIAVKTLQMRLPSQVLEAANSVLLNTDM